VIYTGPQALHIEGANAVIDAQDGDFSVFASTGGGSLVVRGLTFQNSATYGLFVEVPSSATDDLWVGLNRVTVLDTGLHGVYIKDCDEKDGSEPGLCEEDDSGSSASIFLEGSFCRVEGGGTGELDFDGIRVDERGEGEIIASFHSCHVDGNGGDGLELDEAQEGDVVLKLVRSTFDENGFFNEADLDDGVDIDEAGEGGIDVVAIRTEIARNKDEGLDLDEAGAGDVRARLTRLEATGNTDENVKIDEEDEGDLKLEMKASSVRASADQEGMQLEEIGPGDLKAKVTRSEFVDNEDVGIKAVQEDGGEGRLVLNNVTLEGNADPQVEVENVDLIERP